MILILIMPLYVGPFDLVQVHNMIFMNYAMFICLISRKMIDDSLSCYNNECNILHLDLSFELSVGCYNLIEHLTFKIF